MLKVMIVDDEIIVRVGFQSCRARALEGAQLTVHTSSVCSIWVVTTW